ncbi:MAG: energy transducer TonB [Niabella sp.]
MEKTKILTASFMDILFDGRNKAYGAYELRTTYDKRMLKAIAITTCFVLAVVCVVYIKNTFAANNKSEFRSVEHTIVDIKAIDEKPEPEKLPPPPVTKPIDVPKVQTVKLTTPVVVDNKDVVEPPPTQSELAEARIGTITQAGVKDASFVLPIESIDNDKGIILVKKPDPDENIIVRDVNIEASYFGGNAAWIRFLERNLRGEVPVEKGASPNSYKVIIEFVVDVDGTVSQIKPLTSLGYGMEEEAMRVIKKSGKWKPAVLKGREVKAYRKQPITFRVLDQ